MSLASGIYAITSKASNGPVGRYPIEILLPSPNEVFALTQEAQAGGAAQSYWFVRKLESGKYELSTKRAPADVIDGRVKCILEPPFASSEISIDGKFWTLASDTNPEDTRGPKVLAGEKQGDASLFKFTRIDRE
ncbi:hypothetical protein BOTBODRAFT_645600 [Botryobasidium botryosum FD-172 SS1]|uniref:Ricin B lectin domain-containing protein n=1 Tax=Botryobasidium botryosum (strain FD-172 SS1) TaxID=930990 RepID=A0A067LYG4_BOTB1|nr:hypothetical protein BOTBODRAFT_645600 [Botryobasidium botryosum FD-172 SS1]